MTIAYLGRVGDQHSKGLTRERFHIYLLVGKPDEDKLRCPYAAGTVNEVYSQGFSDVA